MINDTFLESMQVMFEVAYKESYYLRDNLVIPIISKPLSEDKIQEKIIEFTGQFIDSHSYQLTTSGPVHTFTFSDKEKSILYNLFNTTEEDILELTKNMFKSLEITGGAFHIIKEAPHKILITAILIESLNKKYDDMITCCEYLMGLSEYPLMYKTFWPKGGVREDIMNYTIEHLPNKFKVKNKKMNNLLELLKYDVNSAVNYWTNELKIGKDGTYMDFIYRVRNQLKSTFKNIAKEYYANHKNNSSQHTMNDRLEDGNLADQSGHTSNIASISNNTYSKIAAGGINSKLAEIAASGNSVDKNLLMGFINQISSSSNNRIDKFIEILVTVYFSKNPTVESLGSGEFVSFGLSLYRSLGGSKNDMYKMIKQILSYWLDDIINIRQYYNREATIIGYTRAIYNYMILLMNYYN